MVKRLASLLSVALLLTVAGVAVASTTGNDNGHGDNGCHVGEQGNGVITYDHCPSPSPSASASPSKSPSPSVSPSTSPSPSVSPSASPSPEASPKLPAELPDTGGSGTVAP